MDLHHNEIAIGKVTGTGAAINVQLGFKPRAVHLMNETTQIQLFWSESMAAAKGVKTIANGTVSFIASAGISQYSDSTLTNKDGFTLGTDSINGSADVIHYIAFR